MTRHWAASTGHPRSPRGSCMCRFAVACVPRVPYPVARVHVSTFHVRLGGQVRGPGACRSINSTMYGRNARVPSVGRTVDPGVRRFPEQRSPSLEGPALWLPCQPLHQPSGPKTASLMRRETRSWMEINQDPNRSHPRDDGPEPVRLET